MGNFVSVSCDESREPPSSFLSRRRKALDNRSPEGELEEVLYSEPGVVLFDRPRYHVMPAKGWMNDPNGPVKVNGRYHL